MVWGANLLDGEVGIVAAKAQVDDHRRPLNPRCRDDFQTGERRKEDLLLHGELRDELDVGAAVDHPHTDVEEHRGSGRAIGAGAAGVLHCHLPRGAWRQGG